MKINRVILENYRVHKKREFEFTKGINLVLGKNGAGKSSILEAIGLTLFGGQGAGIAALGTAIGVPLWVVFGAGAAFAGVLYEEITGNNPNPKTTYRVTDAEREDKS